MRTFFRTIRNFYSLGEVRLLEGIFDQARNMVLGRRKNTEFSNRFFNIYAFIHDEPIQKEIRRRVVDSEPFGDAFWEKFQIPSDWANWILTLKGHLMTGQPLPMIAGEIFWQASTPSTPYQSKFCVPKDYAARERLVFFGNLRMSYLCKFITWTKGISDAKTLLRDIEIARSTSEVGAKPNAYKRKRAKALDWLWELRDRKELFETLAWGFDTGLGIKPDDLVIEFGMLPSGVSPEAFKAWMCDYVDELLKAKDLMAVHRKFWVHLHGCP